MIGIAQHFHNVQQSTSDKHLLPVWSTDALFPGSQVHQFIFHRQTAAMSKSTGGLKGAPLAARRVWLAASNRRHIGSEIGRCRWLKRENDIPAWFSCKFIAPPQQKNDKVTVMFCGGLLKNWSPTVSTSIHKKTSQTQTIESVRVWFYSWLSSSCVKNYFCQNIVCCLSLTYADNSWCRLQNVVKGFARFPTKAYRFPICARWKSHS